jgi:hypothetical protein
MVNFKDKVKNDIYIIDVFPKLKGHKEGAAPDPGLGIWPWTCTSVYIFILR